MSKSFQVSCCTSIVLCLGSFGLLLTSFIFAILARNQLSTFKETYESFIANWDQDMVFDLSLSATPALASTSTNYYVSSWGSNWPGNNPGCHCSSSDASLEVTVGLHNGGCNSNQTQAGCTDIEERGTQMMNKLMTAEIIYSVRGKDTSFLDNYRKMDSKGDCQTGYRRCGNPNSKSKGLCIANSYANCPLTDIRVTEQAAYSSLTLSSGAKIYFASADTANTISELMIVQHHACFVRGHLGYTPGRSVYQLLKGNYADCREDTLPMYLYEVGEKDLLARNNIDAGRLIEFRTSNDYKYKLAAARYVDWSVDCSDTVESMTNKQEDLKKLSKDFLALFILYIISFSLSTIAIIAKTISFIADNTKLYKWMLFVRICLWIMVVPSIFITWVQSKQFTSFFLNIAELGCSDSATNAQFVALGNDFQNKLGYKNNIVLILSMVGMFTEICMGILDLCFLPKSSESTYST